MLRRDGWLRIYSEACHEDESIGLIILVILNCRGVVVLKEKIYN